MFNFFDCWCSGVCDLILQHLTVKELLILTEVSTTVSDFVIESKKFKENVAFSLKEKSKLEEKSLRRQMAEVQRDYENLVIDGNDSVQFILPILRHFKPSWKRVRISNIVFNGSNLLQKFLNDIVQSLEELVIRSVFIFDCDKRVQISFTKLSHLEIFEGNDKEGSISKRVSFVVGESSALRSLKLVFSGVAEENQKRMLKEAKKLRNLELIDCRGRVFLGLYKDVDFRLEELSITIQTRNCCKLSDFIAFLKTQQTSLRKLKVKGWASVDLLQLAFSLPRLESLELAHASCCFQRINRLDVEQRLQTNETLSQLILRVPCEQLMQIFIARAPNLNSFQVFNCDDDGPHEIRF